MKFRIKDDFGENYEVEEIQDDELTETETDVETMDDDVDYIEENEIQDDGESLSSEEISALKKLASCVDKLLALCSSDDESVQDDEMAEEEIDETMVDADEDFVEENEEVIDTNPMMDSIGSLERKGKSRDSKLDAQEQIANKWQENYSKFNK